jgi:hypothetical protein
MIKVIHLTHTDLRYDNRIRKEVSAIENLEFINVTAVGTSRLETATASNLKINSKIISLELISNSLPKKIRALVYFIYLFEITIRFYLICRKLKPDIIHCHDTMVLPTGVLYKIFNNTKIIYDAHELESNKSGQNFILSKATLLIERLSWRFIDAFISVSNSIINWYNINIGSKESYLIMNAPLLSNNMNLKYCNNYLREKFLLPQESLLFIYVGDFARGRSIENLLKIFSEFNSNLHIVFVGFGELNNKISGFADKYSNIHLHAAVPHEDVVKVVSSADIGLCLIENVSLSDYYSLPNKFFEYAFSKLFILSSNLPELKFYLEKYHLGITSELELKNLREQILIIPKVLKKNQLIDLSELSWEKQATSLQFCYTKLFIEINKKKSI